MQDLMIQFPQFFLTFHGVSDISLYFQKLNRPAEHRWTYGRSNKENPVSEIKSVDFLDEAIMNEMPSE